MKTKAFIEVEIEVLENQLEDKKSELGDIEETLQDAIDERDRFELDESEYEDAYIEMLDEQGDIYIGNISFSPSDILSKLDPIAYRLGLSDFVDSMDVTESPEYIEFEEKVEALEEEKEALETAIEKMQDEIEELKEVLEELENEE